MTDLTKERIEGAKVFFEEQLNARLEGDKELAAQDDPAGIVHPIYVGKLVEPYYRTVLALLDQHKPEPPQPSEEEQKEMVSALQWVTETLIERKLLGWNTARELGKIRSLILSAPAPRKVSQKWVHDTAVGLLMQDTPEQKKRHLSERLRDLGLEVEEAK